MSAFDVCDVCQKLIDKVPNHAGAGDEMAEIEEYCQLNCQPKPKIKPKITLKPKPVVTYQSKAFFHMKNDVCLI